MPVALLSFLSHLKHINYMVHLLFLQVEPLWEVNILLFRFLRFKYLWFEKLCFLFCQIVLYPNSSACPLSYLSPFPHQRIHSVELFPHLDHSLA